MAYLLLTIAGSAVLIAAVEYFCWTLFYRKADELRFPTAGDPEGSHTYWLRRLRIFAVGHSLFLIICSAVFFIALW